MAVEECGSGIAVSQIKKDLARLSQKVLGVDNKSGLEFDIDTEEGIVHLYNACQQLLDYNERLRQLLHGAKKQIRTQGQANDFLARRNETKDDAAMNFHKLRLEGKLEQ